MDPAVRPFSVKRQPNFELSWNHGRGGSPRSNLYRHLQAAAFALRPKVLMNYLINDA